MRKILVLLVCVGLMGCSVREHVIKMDRMRDGIYEVPLKLNDLAEYKFMLDTGCAESTIPAHVFYHMVVSGVVSTDDMLASRDFRLADGSIVTCERFVLRKMVIGDIVLRDVSMSITKNGSPLLLGQNVLSRFGFVEIDYSKDLIILKK